MNNEYTFDVIFNETFNLKSEMSFDNLFNNNSFNDHNIIQNSNTNINSVFDISQKTLDELQKQHDIYVFENEVMNIIKENDKKNETKGVLLDKYRTQKKRKTVTRKRLNYLGVYYEKENNKYMSRIYFRGKELYLGKYESEEECAKMYNKQALWYNENYNCKYRINPEFDVIPENVREQIANSIKNKKTSKYIGVCKISKSTSKKHWRACVVYNGKRLHIGEYEDESEAARDYNYEASRLNKQCGFEKYKLNDI